MLKFYEERKVLAITLLVVFCLITRSADLVLAIMVFLVVTGLPSYSLSRGVMKKLASINIVLSIILGVYYLALQVLLRIDFPYSHVTLVSVLSFIMLVITLFGVAMAIVFMVKEKNKDILGKLFAIALVIPVANLLYIVTETAVLYAINNFFRDVGVYGASVGLSTYRGLGLFTMAQVILLVYILVKQKEDNIKDIETDLQ